MTGKMTSFTITIEIRESDLRTDRVVPLPAAWTAEQTVEWLQARAAGDTARCVEMLRAAGWKVAPQPY